MLDEKFFALDHVKAMQEDVKPWPEQGYPGVMLITERWLNHWKKRKGAHALLLPSRSHRRALGNLQKPFPP